MVPGHSDSPGVVNEVIQIELAMSIDGSNHFAHPAAVDRHPVGRQSHHLVLVAVLWEPEKLRERGIEDAEGVGELDRSKDLDFISSSNTPHHAAEVPESVHGNHRGLLER